MSALLECIPNFSEARRPEVVNEIKEAILSINGVKLLDIHSDMDHNRTVITIMGSPEDVEEAAYQGIRKAAELIDMDQHRGEHPRIGATDVVPFIPIQEVTMLECVEMARRLGKRVGDELLIPVYLYEESATRPERRNLEDIRSGQYEGLKTEIKDNPLRSPDFGPHKLGKAGAVVIGAREPLIAFNIYLTTDDVEIARKIAKTVRYSSGGLRYVKAMGVLVGGLAQVSMNLTNFHQSPMAQVVEFVRREAQHHGVNIHHSELVGLIPQQSLIDAAVWYMQMDQFEPGQILESKLSVADSKEIFNRKEKAIEFLDELASAKPTPGGGSAAAFTAAEAAALVAMVARLTVGKKKYASIEPEMWSVIENAEKLRVELTELIQEDAYAFQELLTAMKLPKGSPDEEEARKLEIEKASLVAAKVPLQTARLAVEVQRLATQVARVGNVNAISDAGTAAMLAFAAISGAGGNVRINIKDLPQTLSSSIETELEEIELAAKNIDLNIRDVIKERANFILN